MQHQQWEYYNKKLSVSDRSIPWAGMHHANDTAVDVRLRDQASSLLKVSGSYGFFAEIGGILTFTCG